LRKNTVLSAGGGIFYSGQETFEGGQPANNLPWAYNPSFDSDGVTPIIKVSTGFPAFSTSQQPADPSVTSFDVRWFTPYYDEWNLSLQQGLAHGMSVQLSYAGSKGTHLLDGLNLNQVVTPGPGDIQPRRPY